MKIDMSQRFKDLINGGFLKSERTVECKGCGTDIRIPVGVYIGGDSERANKCPVCGLDFEIPSEIKYTTLGEVCVDALLRQVKKDEGADNASKRKRARLADVIIDAGKEVELENKEAVFIEGRIEKTHPPMVIRQAGLMLNLKKEEKEESSEKSPNDKEE